MGQDHRCVDERGSQPDAGSAGNRHSRPFAQAPQGLVHDFLDGAGTTAALSAAAEAAVDLPGSARQILGHGIADVVVGQDVTGTNDHG